MQRSLTPTLCLTVAYVGNKGTHTLGDGDSNGTNPNEAAVNLPAQYSVNGQALHYDPSVKAWHDCGRRRHLHQQLLAALLRRQAGSLLGSQLHHPATSPT